MFATKFKNYWTTAAGALLAALIYAQGIGPKMPETRNEWWTFVIGVGIAVFGFVSKDAMTGSKPPIILLALILSGCASMYGVSASMTADQIKEYAKIKDANVSCFIVNTPYGKGSALFLNLDKGVMA